MPSRRSLVLFLQLIFSVGVLFWLVRKLGAGALLDAFSHLDAATLFLGVVAYIVAQGLSAWRWAILSRIFRFRAAFWNYAQLYFLGMFYNLFLPSGYGGDVVKVFYQAPDRKIPSKTLSALTIFLDRLTGLLALLLLGGLCSWGLRNELGLYGAVMGWGFAASMLLGFLGLFFVERLRFLPRKLRFAALAIRAHFRKFVPVALLSVVIQLLNVAIYYFLFFELGASLSFVAVCFAYSIVTIATLLPVSIGGLGVRESGWAALMLAFGAAPSIGVTAGLIYFILQTLSSLLGLWPFFTRKLTPSS